MQYIQDIKKTSASSGREHKCPKAKEREPTGKISEQKTADTKGIREKLIQDTRSWQINVM